LFNSTQLSDKTLEYSKEITTALLGVDRLYRLESGDEEGLVVVDMSAGEFQPEIFADYDEARQRWKKLRTLAEGLPEADRRKYYDQLCHSTLAFIEWRQNGLPFTEQLSSFLHVPAAPASDDQLDELCRQMRDLLNQMGYSGDLAMQFTAWENRTRVPADEVPDVLREMLNQAWDRTETRLHIPAEKSDGMKVCLVSGKAFNARCDYLRRTIELNTDPILTRSGLKHLIVHEAYPGHYVQFKLRETWYREGTAPADGLLSVVNTASSSTFEGIADNGMILLDWIETDDDRLQSLLNRYRSGIGTGAAWRLHALGWSIEQTTDWLRERALTGGEGWIVGRMRFLSAPARAVLIWSYWWGEAVVTPAYLNVSHDRRPDFLRYLYGRMHSNETVGMFI
jgi:hypothetical protein